MALCQNAARRYRRLGKVINSIETVFSMADRLIRRREEVHAWIGQHKVCAYSTMTASGSEPSPIAFAYRQKQTAMQRV